MDVMDAIAIRRYRRWTIIALIWAMIASAIIFISEKSEERKLVDLMESSDSFDGETVDRLWHFNKCHNCSSNFLELYDRKIKPLPGWNF